MLTHLLPRKLGYDVGFDGGDVPIDEDVHAIVGGFLAFLVLVHVEQL